MPSELKVNKLSPYTGSTLTLGDSGDTITLASGVSLTGVNATFSGDLTVDTDTLYVDSANNSVGIGTTSPSGKLTVEGDYETLRVENTNTSSTGNSWQLLIEDDSTVNQGDANHTQLAILSARPTSSTGSLIKVLNSGKSNTAFILKDNGNVGIGTSSPSQALDVVGSIEVSGGVYLGGTVAANELDDYEEGTWTPNLDFATSSTGSLSYTQNTGFYVKVGRSVFITAFINWNANNFTASSGSLRVSGLPFAASSTQDYRGGVAITYTGTPWTGVTIYQQAFRSEANQTVMTFDYSDGTDGSMNTDITSHTNIQSNGEFMISGTYVV